MIPLLTADQLRQVDAKTIVSEPISAIQLMERAAVHCTNRLMESLAYDVPVVILAGMGNNGGDGLAMARHLHSAGQQGVQVVVPRYKPEGSPDFEENLRRARDAGIPVRMLEEGTALPVFDPRALVIDALFGTGLHQPIKGWLKSLVMELNKRLNHVLAIDLPSGLFVGNNAGNDLEAIVQAERTFTLELPKIALLMADHARFTGDWEVVPIGLDRTLIAVLKTDAMILEESDAGRMLPKRKRTDHKGDHGHAWLLAGGPGKMGAALLAAKACVRSGCGLLTLHVPQGQDSVVHAVLPEAMVSVDESLCLSTLPKFTKVDAIGIGPGMGMDDVSARLLKLLIQEAPAPLIMDADALNILAENKTWMAFLPAGTILTPHPKEFERLGGTANSDEIRLTRAKEMAVRFKLVVVLKGAYTAICSPDGRIFFNTTGNPGMAKGGSGDALTGIITSLRAQGLDPLSAAMLGVYAHGLAGDLAAKELGMDGMMPSDLIERLTLAWSELRKSSGPAEFTM